MNDSQAPTLRQAVARDWARIKSLLLEHGLPVSDLGADKLGGFLVAQAGSDVVGLVGLQIYGNIALLRSLVVAKKSRSLGLGCKLIDAAESAAQIAGVSEIWLLTIDAENFFKRYGFVIVDRKLAPTSIEETEEFSGLCPGTAFLMQKVLT